MNHKPRSMIAAVGGIAVALVALVASAPAAAAWEPTKPVEFVVPAGTGGGADQMARLIQGIVAKHNLMKQPIIVVNKSGGAGAEGFLDVKGAKGDPHKIIITLSNLFTTPLATGVPFNWQRPDAGGDAGARRVRAVGQRRHAVQDRQGLHRRGQGRRPEQDSRWAAPAPSRKTRSSPSRIEKATGAKFIYMPFKGGGEVAVQLVGKHIDSTVNNPIEAVAQWRAGKLRAAVRVRRRSACPTRTRSPTSSRGTTSRPARKPGVASRVPDAARHLHAARRRRQDQVDFYVDLLKKVRETPEWKDFMEKGAFNQTLHDRRGVHRLAGARPSSMHRELMKEAGFLAK